MVVNLALRDLWSDLSNFRSHSERSISSCLSWHDFLSALQATFLARRAKMAKERRIKMPKAKSTPETKEVVKFDVETAVIVALDAKYKDVQITDGKSYDLIMAGLAEYRELRLVVTAGHKEEKDDALKYCQFLDAEKRRILARLAPGEDKLKAIRQAWDDEKERIKAEKIRLEEERKENIRAEIHKIQEMAMNTILGAMPLEGLRELSDRLEDIEIKEEQYMEFTEQAEKTLNDAYDAVLGAKAVRIKLDQEAEERKAEDERLEKVRKKQEAAQAKIDKAEQKAAKRQTENDAKMIAEQAKIDEERRKIEDEKQEAQARKNKLRRNVLFLSGLNWDGEQYCFMDINVHWTDIVTLSDEEFDHLTEDLRLKIDSRKKEEAERIAKEAKALAEAAAAQKIKDDALKKEEEEKAEEAEKARQEALKPDKEKLMNFSQNLYTLTLSEAMPICVKPEAKKIVAEAFTCIRELAERIKEQAQEL